MGVLRGFQSVVVAGTISGCIGMPLSELKESPHVANLETPKSAEEVFRCVRVAVADHPKFNMTHPFGFYPLSHIEAQYYPETRLGDMWMSLDTHGHVWRLEVQGTEAGASVTRYASRDGGFAAAIDEVVSTCI